jgi:hypothetical protein
VSLRFQESAAVTLPVRWITSSAFAADVLTEEPEMGAAAESDQELVTQSHSLDIPHISLSAPTSAGNVSVRTYTSSAAITSPFLKFASVPLEQLCLRHVGPSLWADYLYRLAEVRQANTTSGLKIEHEGSFDVETIIAPSPEATAFLPVPEVSVVVHNPMADYERYSEANWDCYGAEPISAETRTAARQFLDMLPDVFGAPHISPGADGTVGLEWIFQGMPLRKLYIDVGPGKVWSLYWRKASGERRTVGPRPIDASTEAELGELFRELST